MSTDITPILKNPNVAKRLFNLNVKYDVVPAECRHGLSNTNLFMEKLGIDNLLGNPAYTATTHTKEEI